MGKKRRLRRIGLLVPAILIVGAALYFLISGYVKSLPKLDYAYNENTLQSLVAYPDANFAVISDLHYYDASLGTAGSAFEDALNSDRKLIKDSADLLEYAVNDIVKSGVQFVLVPGDLTKDGEAVNHVKVHDALSRLKDNGISVYVIPGNHDVNNPGAVRYEGDKIVPVDTISAGRFAELYGDFGYGNALYRDSNSLSYVAQLNDNLWLLAIDSCLYRENKPGGEAITEGSLTQDQEKWIESILKLAEQNKKAVMVMMHHGVVEHWKGQSKLHPEYLVQDYRYVGKLLASYNVRLAFTGHYHAQDITLSDFGDGGFIYDVETGSLITTPCAIRYCSISGDQIDIRSSLIAGALHPGTDFEEKGNQFVLDTVKREAFSTLRKYRVPEKDADLIAGYVSQAFAAHYKGDENIADKPAFDTGKLSLWSRLVYSLQKYVVDGLWSDLPPADNGVKLDLLSTK